MIYGFCKSYNLSQWQELIWIQLRHIATQADSRVYHKQIFHPIYPGYANSSWIEYQWTKPALLLYALLRLHIMTSPFRAYLTHLDLQTILLVDCFKSSWRPDYTLPTKQIEFTCYKGYAEILHVPASNMRTENGFCRIQVTKICNFTQYFRYSPFVHIFRRLHIPIAHRCNI